MHLLLELFTAYIKVRRVAYMVHLFNVRSGGLSAYMRGRGMYALPICRLPNVWHDREIVRRRD
jgi:hypothetical protein